MTMDGYIVTEVYSGAVNGDTFNSFVERRLIPALRAEETRPRMDYRHG
jgi:uncharacterized membrane-anchored protein